MKIPFIAKYAKVIINTEVKANNYDPKLQLSHLSLKCIGDEGTKETFTVEPSDPDDFYYPCESSETRSSEPSDPDDFISLGPLTESTEPDEPDDFIGAL